MRLVTSAFAALILLAASTHTVVETFDELSTKYKAGAVIPSNDSASGSSTDITQGVTFTKSGLGGDGVSQTTIYASGTSASASQTGSSGSGSSNEVTQQTSPSTDKSGSSTNATPDNPSQDNPSSTEKPPILTGDCILTGDYVNNTDVRKCDSIIIDSLKVPAGVTLNLTKLQNHTEVSFQGITTFGTKLWDGPLVKLQGNNLTVTGPGTLDRQGAWYQAPGNTY